MRLPQRGNVAPQIRCDTRIHRQCFALRSSKPSFKEARQEILKKTSTQMQAIFVQFVKMMLMNLSPLVRCFRGHPLIMQSNDSVLLRKRAS